ncbi:hypothetical protein V6Z12_A04G085100 [Gossypium hirsutum]
MQFSLFSPLLLPDSWLYLALSLEPQPCCKPIADLIHLFRDCVMTNPAQTGSKT